MGPRRGSSRTSFKTRERWFGSHFSTAMNPGQGEAAQRPSDEVKDKELASTSFTQVTKYKAVSFNLLSLSKAIESELQREPVR
jgi:hypothetical protein